MPNPRFDAISGSETAQQGGVSGGMGGGMGAAPPPTLTKIVATIGPASDSPEVVRRLILAGVSIFRFNFSHGDLNSHAKRLMTVRQVAAELDRPIACLGDLQGPKIRVGMVPDGGLMLEPGTDVLLRKGVPLAFVEKGENGTSCVVLPLAYEKLVDEVEPGHKVLINDGLIRMVAVERNAKKGELKCRVLVGGLVTSKKGINLPQSTLSAAAITEQDWNCVEWAVANGLDFLALSFVRNAAEVLELKEKLAGMCSRSPDMDPAHEGLQIQVVSKIEKPEALTNLEAIVEASDAIMVARGDLGVEMDVARVPVAQKEIIACAQSWGRPVIVATQMLETMIENAIPTRAEASDVANAIFDQTDAVMLSAESASGKHPVLVVETMKRIAAVAEERLANLPQVPSPPLKVIQKHYPTAALAHGAWHIAADMGAKLIVCWSQNGGTARFLSQTGFRIPILACSSSPRATRRMNLLLGVMPVCMEAPATLAEWNVWVDAYLLSHGLVARGDPIVLLAGRPLGRAKATNTIAVHFVGENERGYRAHK